jgi:phage baseplate assembly protein gpV
MTMNRLMAAQARSVVGQVSQFGAPRFGLVASFNPQTYCAKVMIQPENTLTGWLPILSPWVGPGWGFVAPLPLGVQVLVLPDRNDAQQGVIAGVLYSDVDTPPNSAAAGEILLLHQNGAFLTLKNDGSVDIAAPGGLNIAGNVSVTGTIAASGDVIGAGVSLDNHEHSYVPGTGGSTLTGKGQG